jgi:UDP-GlcNAc:undecaprenyl-phosphate GlcNAc-1-phosphate transferase
VASGVPVWVAVATVSVYLADVLTTLARRWLAGKPLMSAHREHVYQQLTPVGSSHLATACLVTAVSAVVGGCALAAWLIHAASAGVLFGGLAAVTLLAYLTAPWLRQRFALSEAPATAAPLVKAS